MKIKDGLFIFSIGSVTYSFIEILWRGYTHWTMGILGGICMFLIYVINVSCKANILLKAVISATVITLLEFVTGVIVNLIFKLNVWDYSPLRFNVLGQVSLLYSFLWFLLCIPCLFLCTILKHRIFDAMPVPKAPNKNF